jgi:hypothetical protein
MMAAHSSRPRVAIVFRLLKLIGMAALVWLGMDGLRPPACPSPPAGGRDDQFSCEQAIAHVRAIAYRKHPAGSKADANAREYLLDTLRDMGFSPQVQATDAYGGRGPASLPLYNILVRLPGTQGGAPAVMLACHYDSVPMGPGASDDGVAVGALVETLRVLKAGPPLRNDIILLITDGEELGMRGAEGFVREHPWARDVGLVLNFDARGTDGPSIMFQASPGNAALIRAFPEAAPYPVATSMAGDVYRHMPNDTDFTIFAAAGMKGLNFAFIGNYIYYHTSGDNLVQVDLNTLYHDGTYAVSLARLFGNMDLAALPAGDHAPDAVYFSPVRGHLVTYGIKWVWPLTGLLLVLTFAACGLATRRGWISGRGVADALLRLVAGTGVSTVAVYGAVRATQAIFQRWPDCLTPTGIACSAGSFTAIAIFVTLCFALIRRRGTSVNDLAAAGALAWAAIAIPVSIWLPGGSYLVVWPALFALLGFVLNASGRITGWTRCIVSLLAAAPLLVLMSPSLDLFYTALTYRGAHLVAPLVCLTIWLLITSGCFDAVFPLRRQPAHAEQSANERA